MRGRTGLKNEMMSRNSGRPAADWARLIRQRDCFSPAASTASSLTVTLTDPVRRVLGYADTRFLLLHDPHKDDNIIKAFFYEVRWTDLHSRLAR